MDDQAAERRRRQGARRGAGHPLHPALVHRHPRPAEVVLDQRRRARRRLRGRHGLRRLLDHRLQRDRGVGHDRDARPDDVQRAAVAARGGRRRRRAHVLPTCSRPSASPTRATRATSCAAPCSARRRWGSTTSTSAPSSSTSCFRDTKQHRAARRGRLLRPHDARRRLRRPPRHGARARAARDRRRVLPPRGRAEPARDRHALRRRAEDGRRLHDLPHHGQGVRAQVRLARDVHAQAAVRRERLRDAHPPVAVQGRPQRVLRRRRQVLPVRRRQGVHRRPAAPRARDLLDLRPVGELLQAARARLRGAGLRRLEPAQPLGARARPALPPRQGAGHADGAALPGPRLQPVPDVRGAAAGGAGGRSSTATSCPSRWRRTSTT